MTRREQLIKLTKKYGIDMSKTKISMCFVLIKSLTVKQIEKEVALLKK